MKQLLPVPVEIAHPIERGSVVLRDRLNESTEERERPVVDSFARLRIVGLNDGQPLLGVVEHFGIQAAAQMVECGQLQLAQL
ncbi:hypothetical protein D3C84_1086270 [compost metagenome]